MRARCSLASLRAHGLALVLLAAAFSGAPLFAQTVTQRVDTAVKSGVTIEASNIYSGVPLRGYVPVRVAIDNTTDQDGVWTVSTDTREFFSSSYTTEAQCRVSAHAHDTFEVLAPVDYSTQSYSRSVNVKINGPGVNNPDISWRSVMNYYSPPPPPKGGYAPGVTPPTPSDTTLEVGLSPALATTQASKLSDYFEKSYYQPNFVANLDPDLMSPDWRSYIGFDLMVYTAADWLNLSASVRAAILQWAAAGGDLRLVADQDGGLSLPPRQGEHYGAGLILLFTPSDLANYDFSQVYLQSDERFLFNYHYKPALWQPSTVPGSIVGGKPPTAPLVTVSTFASAKPAIKNKYFMVIMAIVAFSILVGPINLFVICPGVRRSRLLWVTPVISLGASGVLLAFIFLSEGVGGQGIYYRVTLLEPDGKFAVESQVNASRTGMLLSHVFHFAEPAWLKVSDQDRFNSGSNKTFAQLGAQYWGDWFGSRQTQTLEAVAATPTRAAVLLDSTPPADGSAPQAPSLRSEYNGQLEDLFYVDAAGKVWKTARLAKGEVARLQPSNVDEISAAWQSNIISAPEQLRPTLTKLAPLPETFFALGDGSDAPLQPNLSNMTWTSFRHVVTGPVVK